MRRFSLLFSLLALGCGSTVVVAGDGGSTDVPRTDTPAIDVPRVDVPPAGRVPLQHRAAATACPTDRPASSCQSGLGGAPNECRLDAECLTGTNGRCVGNPHDGCRCNYDTCARDSDCTTLAGPCACRLPNRGASRANVCLAGNCRVDADCGARGYCSPTLGDCGSYSGTVGYYCHAPADECVDDADCSALDAGFLGQAPYCAYARELGHWRCANQACAG